MFLTAEMNLIGTLLAEGAPAGGGGMGLLVPMILMFVMFYFLLIRPQKKRQQELQRQIDAMRTGDAVVTLGGIHGIITNKAKETVTVKVADNVKIKFDKASIAKVISRNSGKDDESAEDDVEDQDDDAETENKAG